MQDVGLVFTLMDKAVRQFALYGREHPQAKTALQSLEGKIKDFFIEGDRLHVHIKRTEIEFKGERIFMLDKEENNYVQEMFVDGVREFEILPSVTTDELAGLISVFSRDVRDYQSQEDDTVTLLWKQGFQNIRYQTIDIYAGDLNALLREQMAEDELSKAEKEEKNYLNRFIKRLVEGKARKSLLNVPTKDESTLSQDMKADVPLSRFQIIEDEAVALRDEARGIGNRDYLPEVATVYCEVLEAETEPEDFGRLLEAYFNLVRSLIEAGNIRKASDWLKRLRGVQVFLSQRNPEFHTVVESGMKLVATPDIFQQLGDRLAAGVTVSPDDWQTFFRYLGEDAARVICELLSTSQQEALHRTLTDFLLTHARDKLEVFSEYARASEWMVVRDMVRIFGELLDQGSILEKLKPLAVHPHAEVRREVIRSLARFSGPVTHEIYSRGIKDSDRSVREVSLHAIAKSEDPHFARSLAEEIKERFFLERDRKEMRMFSIALARCGKESAIGFLDQIVREAGSTSDAQNELRIAALYGLADIVHPKAETIIEEFASKMIVNRSVRDSARQILERKRKQQK